MSIPSSNNSNGANDPTIGINPLENFKKATESNPPIDFEKLALIEQSLVKQQLSSLLIKKLSPTNQKEEDKLVDAVTQKVWDFLFNENVQGNLDSNKSDPQDLSKMSKTQFIKLVMEEPAEGSLITSSLRKKISELIHEIFQKSGSYDLSVDVSQKQKPNHFIDPLALPHRKSNQVIEKGKEEAQVNTIERLFNEIYFIAQAPLLDYAIEQAKIGRLDIQAIDSQTPQGRAALHEIAKKLVSAPFEYVFFKNFSSFKIDEKSLDGQAKLIEIAKIIAEKTSSYDTISELIPYLKINPTIEPGKTALVEIAKIAARSQRGEISQFISRYGFDFKTQQKELIEIAKIAAKNNGAKISEHIHLYGINSNSDEGQKALVEISKIAAETDPNILFNTSKYKINGKTEEGQATLIEIAKIAARKNGKNVSLCISHYGINRATTQGQKGLIEIAKIATLNDAEATQTIFNYRIDPTTEEGEIGLIEIAKQVAGLHGDVFAENFKNFDIDSRTERGRKGVFEIAKIALKTNFFTSYCNFRHFNIRDDHTICHLISSIILYCPSEMMKNFSFSFFIPFVTDAISKYPALGMMQSIASQEEDLNSLIKKAIKVISDPGNHFQGNLILEDVAHFITSESNTPLRHNLQFTFASFLLACQLHQLTRGQIERIRPLLKALYELRNPPLRLHLQSYLNEALADPEFISKWETLFKKMQERKHATLSSLLLVPFSNVVNDDSLSNQTSKLLSHHFFKDSRRRDVFLQSLSHLGQNGHLTFANKNKLLKICVFYNGVTPELALKNLQQIYFLILFGQTERLKNIESKEDIENALNGLFSDELGLTHLPGFGDKFLATFGKFRQPDALFQYLGTLKQLSLEDSKPVVALLKDYTMSVLTGTFQEERYAVNKSVHLQEVFKKRPLLEKKWKEGFEIESEELMGDVKINNQSPQIDFYHFLNQSLLTDKHMPENLVPVLVEVLRNPENRSKALESVQEQLKILGVEFSKENNKDLIPQIRMLNIQRYFLELLENTLNTNEISTRISKLSKLFDELVTMHNQSHEIRNDLKGIQKALEIKDKRDDSKPSKFKFTDTDDPCDLLLLGTEVAGSCQRVDGDSTLNKCLVAYLMDGKNRALVIKDETGKIVARSVLRLLIDQKTKEPVLFQERIYPTILDQSLSNLLDKACLARANHLTLPLLSSTGRGDFFPSPIVSLGGCAPYEYVDAAKGVEKDSKFEISTARYVIAQD